jgi:predicted N-formylglutamate amidohydrolase
VTGLPRDDFDFIVSCEHASNAVPDEIDLGVGADVLESHVAWDPGALVVARRLATLFGVECIAGEWTRLVADLNRSATNPEVVPVQAFGVDVPGNASLSDVEVLQRVDRYHRPHWNAVQGRVEQILFTGRVACHISVHSFTEVYQGRHRAVDFGFLIDPDHLLELGVSNYLKDDLFAHDLDVRINEPYDGRDDAVTAALRNRYPADRYIGLEIEISQRHLGRIDDLATMITTVFSRLKT